MKRENWLNDLNPDLNKKLREVVYEYNTLVENIRIHAPIFNALDSVKCHWSEQKHIFYPDKRDEAGRKVSMTAAFGFIHVGLCIDLYMGPNDSIPKQGVQFIKDYIYDPYTEAPKIFDAEPIGQSDYLDIGWVKFIFKCPSLKETISGNKEIVPQFAVRFWFENSEVCKKVPTGKKVDEYELVCTDPTSAKIPERLLSS